MDERRHKRERDDFRALDVLCHILLNRTDLHADFFRLEILFALILVKVGLANERAVCRLIIDIREENFRAVRFRRNAGDADVRHAARHGSDDILKFHIANFELDADFVRDVLCHRDVKSRIGFFAVFEALKFVRRVVGARREDEFASLFHFREGIVRRGVRLLTAGYDHEDKSQNECA